MAFYTGNAAPTSLDWFVRGMALGAVLMCLVGLALGWF